MKKSNVNIQVKAVKGTGFMPEAGVMLATKFDDGEGNVSYTIDANVPQFGGQSVSSSVVTEV